MPQVKRKILQGLEQFLLKRYTVPEFSPLFILGLPRSGTTLLYQYIIHRLQVSYFTNGVEAIPYAAVLNTIVRHKIYGEYVSDFNNSYGKVQGGNAPHEAGSFWGQFFSFQDYQKYVDISEKDIKKMNQVLAGIEQVYGGRPFVNKNVKHLLRIDALARIFPKAKFIIIHRNLKDVALSLIRGRYDNIGHAEEWWSVRPPNWQELDHLAPPKQIAHQLIELHKQLNKDLNRIKDERIFEVSYKTFCQSPESFILKLSKGLGIARRNTDICPQFKNTTNTAKTNEEKELIRQLSISNKINSG